MFIFIVKVSISVADPGFPRGGCGNCKGGDANLLFLPIFPQNCMKLKKFGPGGSVPDPPPPLDPPMYIIFKETASCFFPLIFTLPVCMVTSHIKILIAPMIWAALIKIIRQIMGVNVINWTVYITALTLTPNDIPSVTITTKSYPISHHNNQIISHQSP